MDIDINHTFNINRLLKNKKRVVSTLFLFLLIFNGCDFKSPEEWEMPAWYVDFTLPLTNLELSFEELVNDSTILADSISDVIHVTYPMDLPKQSLPNSIFNINAEALGLTSPAIDMNEPIDIPITELSQSISFELPDIESEIGIFNECFPIGLVDTAFPDQNKEGNIDGLAYPSNSIFSINEVTSDSGYWLIIVGNNFSFPIGLQFELLNGDDAIFTSGDDLNNISPYEIDSSHFPITVDDPEIINLTKSLTYNLIASVPEGQTPDDPCQIYFCLGDESEYYADDECGGNCIVDLCIPFSEGWPTQEGSSGIEFTIKYVSKLKSVEIEFNGIEDVLTWKQELPGYEGFSIKKAILTESSSLDTNMLLLDIINNTPVGFTFEIKLLNFFENIDEGGDYLTAQIDVPSEGSITFSNEVGQVNFGGYILAAENPNLGFSNLSAIDSLEFIATFGLEAFTNTIEVIDYQISLGVEFNSFEIRTLSLDYIAAITDRMQLPVTESPDIEGIPDGFTDIEFMDMEIEIELINEIGIPIDLDFDIEGTKEGSGGVIFPIETELGVPINNVYQDDECIFNENDSVRTLITTNKDYQITELFCHDGDGEWSTSAFDTIAYLDYNEDDELSSLVELMNFVPEKFNMSGDIIIDGEGVLLKESALWGNIIITSPLSFIFKKPITIIPATYTSLPPMDASTSEMIDSSLIEASLYVEITNRSPAGGNLSILISDSTVFPLFLDSLITGTWDENLSYQQSEFGYQFYQNPDTDQPWAWDSLGINIDSISFIPIDPLDDDSKAKEVKFFDQGNLQFFVGRLVDLQFPTSDSLNSILGYANTGFPGFYTSITHIDTSNMSWIITDESRKSSSMITFDGSPLGTNDQFVPITLQTTNAIEVQTMLTIKLDTGGLGSKE